MLVVGQCLSLNNNTINKKLIWYDRPRSLYYSSFIFFLDIHCDKLSGAAHDKYSMASFSGQGRKYDINVLEGLFSADTVPYGPV